MTSLRTLRESGQWLWAARILHALAEASSNAPSVDGRGGAEKLRAASRDWLDAGVFNVVLSAMAEAAFELSLSGGGSTSGGGGGGSGAVAFAEEQLVADMERLGVAPTERTLCARLRIAKHLEVDGDRDVFEFKESGSEIGGGERVANEDGNDDGNDGAVQGRAVGAEPRAAPVAGAAAGTLPMSLAAYQIAMSSLRRRQLLVAITSVVAVAVGRRRRRACAKRRRCGQARRRRRPA